MAAPADSAVAAPGGLLPFLREELATRPGRVAAVARSSFCCVVVVFLGQLYQVPLTAYMAYAVLLISGEETASTLLGGVMSVLAFSIAVALSLLFYMLDAAEPALRLPLMALSTFAAMFLSRTVTLGPVAFLVGFVLVISQTLIDQLPTLEALTRFVLWLWPVVTIPVTVTVLVNLAFGVNASKLARRTAMSLFDAIAEALRSGDGGALQRHKAEATKLLELRVRAGMLDHSLKSRAAIDTALIETLAELITLIPLLPADMSWEARRPLHDYCEECATAFAANRAPAMTQLRLDDSLLNRLTAEARPVALAIAAALSRLGDGIARRESVTGTAEHPAAKSLFVPDAFTNPAHARYAIKVTIAVMAVYILYTGVAWEGIRTSVTTCFFVALGSLGESVHKLTLRLTGAVTGGLLGGLCIVFVLPHMTDIGQLLLLIAAVTALGAWVATSSERLSYGGMQMAFAFYLGVLQGFGPSDDLTILRDRVAGILLGNIVISLVFSALWPTSARDRALAALSTAFRTLGQMLADPSAATAGTRLAVIRALGDARRFDAIATFELGLLAKTSARPEPTVDSVERLAGAAFVVANQEPSTPDPAAASWFAASAAQNLSTGLPPFTPPPAESEARTLLQQEIIHVAAS